MELWFEDEWVIETAQSTTLEEFLEDMNYWNIPTDELTTFWEQQQ